MDRLLLLLAAAVGGGGGVERRVTTSSLGLVDWFAWNLKIRNFENLVNF